MAAARYAYTGGAEMQYPDYRDLDADRMLIAEPGGGPYSMAPVNPDSGLSVPPNDGRWGGQAVSPSKPAPTVSAPAPAPAPAPEGGEV